jgi:hypothetical protein
MTVHALTQADRYFVDFEEVWPSYKTFEQCRNVADIIMVAWGILDFDLDDRPVG